MLPGELRWLMNEQVMLPTADCLGHPSAFHHAVNHESVCPEIALCHTRDCLAASYFCSTHCNWFLRKNCTEAISFWVGKIKFPLVRKRHTATKEPTAVLLGSSLPHIWIGTQPYAVSYTRRRRTAWVRSNFTRHTNRPRQLWFTVKRSAWDLPTNLSQGLSNTSSTHG